MVLFIALGMVLQSPGCREKGLESLELTSGGFQARGRAGCKAEGISINDCNPFSLCEGK